MKNCQCHMCFNQAAYISRNSDLALCEECYESMNDDFEMLLADDVDCCFDEYYDFEYLED